MRCPLCDGPDFESSGFGSVLFSGRVFEYRTCRLCGSAVCDPMPDAEVLGQMYGPTYAGVGASDADMEDPKAPAQVIERLRARVPGRFVDFGCGDGSLLRSGRERGWSAVGVEFDAGVARKAGELSGCPVVTGIASLGASGAVPADVIHLGDVLEHLVAPREVLRELVGLLGPGGWLVAQGPLEAGPCLFSAAVRAARRVRRARPVEMPPYHVIQATVGGQRLLFERAGLDTVEYRVSEVAWPAPARLSAEVARQPRSLALLTLRRLSQTLSSLAPHRLGNRYFYVGVPRQRRS